MINASDHRNDGRGADTKGKFEKAVDLFVFPVALGAVVNSLIGATDALIGITTSEKLRIGLSVISVITGFFYQRTNAGSHD